ncbi:DUF4136 domain-containing protein [Carboxylicivirga sp. A043]|uniref:DUF4136 domain-containing protein n=1 Tax=Carboxylicivirga litoralis TaxID=2816963 RepID=UPI0021CAEAC9|nr:DUF4136 domain-containing protein [Carboxylicivirga sp. A043]MCU4157115.1 DUF4136 domain-containing protein [Carboxylicivirga sp. A043]
MKYFRVALFCLFVSLIVLLSSCSSVKVVSDMDKTVDFIQYKTYSFLGWEKNSDELLTEFDKKRVKDAFANEFKARGLKFVETGGDMEISLFVVVDQKTSTTAYTDYYSTGYMGYRRYRGGWGYGYAETTYSENDYLEGTLVLDVFDASSKEQIWQGVVKSTVTENPEKREKIIPRNIGALMSKFPVKKVK